MAERPILCSARDPRAAGAYERRAYLCRKKRFLAAWYTKCPADLKKTLTSDPQALTAWEDITPLARNEWICWIESAKKVETRSHRIEGGCSSLKDGKRRPCCWPGCAHR